MEVTLRVPFYTLYIFITQSDSNIATAARRPSNIPTEIDTVANQTKYNDREPRSRCIGASAYPSGHGRLVSQQISC
jgi:hypothetical protein